MRKPDIDSGEERNRESEGVREIKKQRETKPRQRKRAEERHGERETERREKPDDNPLIIRNT